MKELKRKRNSSSETGRSVSDPKKRVEFNYLSFRGIETGNQVPSLESQPRPPGSAYLTIV